MRKALGMIESIGITTAIAALDSASKAADITLIGFDKVIGVEKSVSITIHIAGEVAAVNAAIEAGVEAGNKVGRVVCSKTIPRPHEEVDFLIKEFEKNLKEKEAKKSK
ncbi:BMC domain-containing protein [Romboutsia sedimentorum]|uniref:BMC domain-containing protein n=1 Tax=Romboutsia sedimentorum TaxID=1368474 RepID=UPI000478E936|nr:BMC domain-containing protein [Romboutsia sedimentorum]MDK2585555.1 BMC domain-containing protein [Romboutsia sedimentorum]